MKYISKPEEVDAEQFLIEVSHPLLGSDRIINKPEKVIHKKMSDYQDNMPYYKWVVETNKGTFEVKNTDYVVTKKNGNVKVMTKKDFEKKYKKV